MLHRIISIYRGFAIWYMYIWYINLFFRNVISKNSGSSPESLFDLNFCGSSYYFIFLSSKLHVNSDRVRQRFFFLICRWQMRMEKIARE